MPLNNQLFLYTIVYSLSCINSVRTCYRNFENLLASKNICADRIILSSFGFMINCKGTVKSNFLKFPLLFCLYRLVRALSVFSLWKRWWHHEMRVSDENRRWGVLVTRSHSSFEKPPRHTTAIKCEYFRVFGEYTIYILTYNMCTFIKIAHNEEPI